MLVEIQKWGNSAAVRVPSVALKDAGMQIGQSVDMRVEDGRLVIAPATERLEDLLAKITPENQPALVFDDPATGAEAW